MVRCERSEPRTARAPEGALHPILRGFASRSASGCGGGWQARLLHSNSSAVRVEQQETRASRIEVKRVARTNRRLAMLRNDHSLLRRGPAVDDRLRTEVL